MQQVESDVPLEMLPALRHGLVPPITWIRRRTRQQIAAAICVIAMLQAASAVGARNERLGDSIQIALPVLGTACAVLRGDLGDYAARFAGNMAVVHGLKNGLGAAEINLRPGGSTRGFPSGHTAAAVHGASYLVRECGAFVPYAGPLLALGAGFVAGSRIEAGRHDLHQVLAGAIIGLLADLGFRQRRNGRRIVLAWRRLQRRHRVFRPRVA
ncbi:MAG: phosphatase PAP2 family protein [Rhodobacteraceae bacterium]|nr:phosphatase PAP2 family protein [Paracoccaceae bacterium]